MSGENYTFGAPSFVKETDLYRENRVLMRDTKMKKRPSTAGSISNKPAVYAENRAEPRTQQLASTMKERDALLIRIKNLQGELQLALMAAEDIRALKTKMMHTVEQLENEKTAHIRTKKKNESLESKLVCALDHLETMISETKILKKEGLRKSESERDATYKLNQEKKKVGILREKVKAKDKLIAELRHGNFLLDGQLKLMDEKMVYTRKSLDACRLFQRGVVEKSVKESKTLREKFGALTGGSLDQMDITNNSFFVNMASTGAQVDTNSPSGSPGEFSPSPGRVRPGTTGSGSSPRKKKNMKKSLSDNMLDGFAYDQMNKAKKESRGKEVVEKVNDRLRKKNGEQKAWTIESIQELAHSRDRPGTAPTN
jgi:hypothetical protein